MNIDLHKIKPVTFVTAIFIILSTLCAGILFIFIYSKDLFEKTDAIKLILLSMSLTIPTWIINSSIVVFFDESKHEDVNFSLQIFGLIGSIISLPVLYIPILTKLFINISLQTGVIIGTSIEVIIILFLLFNKVSVSNSQKSK